jgi:hypothetical protein
MTSANMIRSDLEHGYLVAERVLLDGAGQAGAVHEYVVTGVIDRPG